VLYDSCVEQTYTESPERFVGGRLRLVTASYLGGASRQIEIVYDRRTPERGIVVVAAPEAGTAR
jgi:hypothetical protein